MTQINSYSIYEDYNPPDYNDKEIPESAAVARIWNTIRPGEKIGSLSTHERNALVEFINEYTADRFVIDPAVFTKSYWPHTEKEGLKAQFYLDLMGRKDVVVSPPNMEVVSKTIAKVDVTEAVKSDPDVNHAEFHQTSRFQRDAQGLNVVTHEGRVEGDLHTAILKVSPKHADFIEMGMSQIPLLNVAYKLAYRHGGVATRSISIMDIAPVVIEKGKKGTVYSSSLRAFGLWDASDDSVKKRFNCIEIVSVVRSDGKEELYAIDYGIADYPEDSTVFDLWVLTMRDKHFKELQKLVGDPVPY